MADNIIVRDGNGSSVTLASDDIGGVQHPRHKMVWGANGAVNDVSAADPMPIALPTGASTAAKQPALGTAGTASADVISIQGIASMTPLSVTPAAGELHLGEVGGNTAIVSLVFSLDTSIYASGDVLADTQTISAAMRKTDGTAILQSITLNDKDDQGIALDVFILDAATSIGTENATPSISDSDADSILGVFSVSGGDWIDIGGCKIATIKNIGLPVKAISGAATLGVALITRGTPTHTASGITARFGFVRN